MTARKKAHRKTRSSVVRKRRQARKRTNALNFEALESRQLLAAITVGNNTDILSPTADISSIAALVANDGGDGISLREAVAAANNTTGEDAITFDANVFTGGDNSLIRLTQGELSITDSLSIDGTSVGDVLITGDAFGDDATLLGTQITDVERSAGPFFSRLDDNSRVLDFSATSGSLTLTSLTITGGRLRVQDDSGAAIHSFGDLTLINSNVSGNSTTGASGFGGGIYISGGDLSVASSVISQNSTIGDNANGGGIASSNGNVSLTNSTVSGNSTTGASGFGGGIYISGGDLSVASSVISQNSTIGDNALGGGIASSNGNVSLTNSTVSGNSTTGASGFGGGIYISGGDLSVASSVISQNSTIGDNANGGGIASSNGNVSLTNSTVSGNSTVSRYIGFNRRGGAGAGIYSTNGSLSLTNSIVSGNRSFSGGAGISSANGVVSLAGSTVSGNISDGTGGGIYVLEGDVSLINSTVSGNSTTSSGRGGGISSVDSTVQLLSSTVTENATSQSEGGGVAFYVNPSQTAPVALVVHNTIVAGNTSNSGSIGDANDLFVSGLPNTNDLIVEYSLIGDSQGSMVTASTGMGNFLNRPALLTPLGNYGGTTQTHALQAGSPALDAGSNALAVDEAGNPLTTDQRGGSRILGTIDIGAIELGDGSTFETRSLVVSTNQDIVDSTDGFTSLREAIRFADDPNVGVNNDGDADGDGSVADAITFDASVFTGGDNNLIRLIRGELAVNQSASIDGSSVGGIVITGDADDDDITLPGTDITDVDASFGEYSGLPDDLLDDNSRVLNFSSSTGDLTLTDLTITGGRSTERFDSGGGIRSTGNLSLNDSTVNGNSTAGLYGNGGGISSSNGDVLLTNSTVSGNSATTFFSDGGGVFISDGDLSLINSTVTENSTTGSENRGGGVFVSSGNAFLTNSAVSGNIASNTNISNNDNRGGGIYIVDGDVSLTDSVVSGNSSFRSRGGGISSSNGDVLLTNSTVSGNTGGGHAITHTDGNLLLTSSTVSGNTGGGISTGDGNLSVINSTISGNSAFNFSYGGGISSRYSTVQIISSTVTANSAYREGGGISVSVSLSGVGGLTIQNSIVAGNTTDRTDFTAIPEIRFQDRSYVNDFVVEYSLIGDTQGSGITTTTGIGNILNTSALLGPLADNGGPTQTHALLVDSPAVNTGDDALAVDENGNPLTSDQRGENRFFGAVDMGAFELQAEGTIETRSLVVTTNLDVVDPDDAVNSLREAIAFANDLEAGRGRNGDADEDGSVSDAISFDPGVFTGGDNNLIRLTQGELVITQNASIDGSTVGGVVITGDADDDDITVDGTHITDVSASFGGVAGAANDLLDDNSRVLDFQGPFPERALALTGLTITGGRATSSNYSGGGGIDAVGDLSLTDSTVSGNSSVNGGGGIQVNSGDLTLTGSVVSGNRTDGGGGGVSAGGNLTITNSTVDGNTSIRSGGGILLSSRGSDAILTNSTVSDNQVVGPQDFRLGGGGIYSFFSDVTLVGSTVNRNTSTGVGGGIYFGSGTDYLFLDASTVSGNSSVRGGGGIRLYSNSMLVATNSTVSDNSTDGQGGGISAGSGDVSLDGSTVSGNISGGAGGGILAVGGDLSLTSSTVSGNSSGDTGGGILNAIGNVLITSSTVTGNSASADGGGITFNSNYSVARTFTLQNSIVAGNESTSIGSDLFNAGNVMTDLSVENSLIGDTAGSGISLFTGSGNILNQTASLGPLADNGGPTQTHALLSGSLAINAGGNAIATAAGLTTDQRGASRIQFGTVDIGAFESDLNERNFVVTTSQDIEDPDDQFTSLREAIVLSNEGSGISTINFDPGLFDVETTIEISSQLPAITDALTITGPGANLLIIDALGGGDNVLDGNGFRIFEVNDGDSNNSIDVSISGLTLTGGDNNDSGGAINNFENLTLDGVALVGNRASFGGGVSNELSGVLTLSRSLVANNEASMDGGGVFTSGELAATNVTISGNSAAGNGGAIVTAGDSSGVMLSLTNSTLANNSGNEGVFFDNDDGPTTASINNTIIDSSIAGVGNGTTLFGGNNLFASTDPGITGTGNLFNQASLLGSLADNGGPTLTHALLFGSPAINAGDSTLAVDENGNPLTTDQRGEDRIRFGAIDIGAVETRFNELRSLVVTTVQDVVDGGDRLTSLREAIAFAAAGVSGDGDADGDGLTADTITFDSSVFTGGDNSVIRLTQGEFSINHSLTIDGSSVGGVVITGDAAGDDILVAGTHVTDATATFDAAAGLDGADGVDLLDDNSRVFDFLDSDLFGAANVTLAGLTITGGRVVGGEDGAGIQFESSGTLTLNQSTVSGNIATGSRADGGGIYASSGDVSLNNSSVTGNISSGNGGGVQFNSRGALAVNQSTISGNIAMGNNANGGGIYARFGDVSLTSSSVTGNVSDDEGGGIYARSNAVSLTDSTVSGNVSAGDGGGIRTSFGELSLTNSTVSGNTSGRDGGGIWFSDSMIQLVNSTVAGNSASGVGGGISFRNDSFFVADRLTLLNSIVAGNTDNGTAPDVEAVGVVVNDQVVENSLIGDTTGSGITATSGTGNILNQSALLGPLADNGGATQTHALLSGSLAINVGSNAIATAAGLTADQRGESRIQFGTVDIGAFESDFNERNLVVTTSLDVEDPDDGFTSLREAIVISNEGSEISAISFDPALFDVETTITISSQLPTITDALTITGPGANLVTIDALGGGDNALDGNGFRIFEVNDGDSNNSVDVSISGLTLTGGDNNDSGGAIDNFENLTLDGVAIVGNRARFGGGVSNDLVGRLTITNSTIANNEASEDGGGIFTGGELASTNVTISGNNAAGNGGAIVSAGDSSGVMLSLTNSTIANNTGNEGVYFDNGNGPTVASFNNTIIDSSITGVGNNGTTLAGSNNLFASADPGITGTGNLFSQTSMLGLLADNGGPTLTHALLYGSPAINAGDSTLAVDENGNPLATDQRGEDRIRFGAVDIGALETEFDEARSLVVTTAQDVVDVSDGFTSLREAIAFAAAGVSGDGDADGDGLTADTITFDSSVFTGGDNSVIRLTQGEFSINHSLTIDGSSVGGVVITGDAAGDDVLIAGTHVTDVSASVGGTAGTSTNLLDDNSRVLNLFDSDLFGAVNVTLTGLTITGGRVTGDAVGGGVQFDSSGSLTLNQSTVSGNIATGSNADGGGIYARLGDVSFTDSSVTGNISGRDGGGIRIFGGNVSLTSSTVSGNFSGRDGGGVGASFSGVSLTNSTVSGNFSDRDGGGIWFNDSRVLLVNSTVTVNSASGVGGGVSFRNDEFFQADRLTLHNSIVAGNTDNGTAPDVEAVGVVVNDQFVENSLIGDTTGSGITATSGTGNILNQSALLGPLADNGGSTLTHALLPGSPAIDTGSNALALDENGNPLITDQSGEVRIESGAVDIGAVEFVDSFLLGDANLDGVVNFLDISPFISLLSSGTFLDEADIDRNGVVNFLDISPFILVLSSGGSADPFLLGDANLDSVVNFLDISPFISLLSSGTFLDEADINRDGSVDFLDISPFISVLSFGGSAPSNLVASNLVAPAIASGSAVTSQSIVVGSPVSSVESLVSVARPASVTSAVEVSTTTVTSDAIDGDAPTLISTVSQDVTATTALPQVSLVLVNDSLASPVNQASDLPVVDAIEAGVTPVDTFIGPVATGSVTGSFLWAGDSSLRGAESNGSLVTRRSLVWDAQWFDLPREARDKHLVPNVSAEESFSTAAELFDAHPESLDEIFDFELEETLAGLI